MLGGAAYSEYTLVKVWQIGDVLEHTLEEVADSLTPGALLYFKYTAVNSVSESESSSEASY